jgi:hypothetical protein
MGGNAGKVSCSCNSDDRKLNVAVYGNSVGLGQAYASNPPTYR